jgi:hypothetical protein
MKKNTFFVKVLMLLVFSCSVDQEAPVGTTNWVGVSTSVATNIGVNSATLGGETGNVVIDGILERGFCWSSNNGTPTVFDNRLVLGTATGKFSGSITGLAPATLYYARAYVKTNLEIVYGNIISFRTLSNPTVVTLPPGSVTGNSAVLNGNITDAGGTPIPSRGICWGNNPNPSIVDNCAETGSGVGFFSVTVSNLLRLTTYYARAFAVTSVGRYYGQQVSFTTTSLVVPPTVSTNILSDINWGQAVGGGNVLSDGGSPVLERGVCWNTTGTPTITGGKFSCGAGTGSFSCGLSGLFPSVTYFVRAYARNAVGVGYGEERVFTTFTSFSSSLTPPVLTYPAPSAVLSCCSVQLTWQYVPGATLYDVQLSKSPTFSGITWAMPDCGANKELVTNGAHTKETSYNNLCVPLIKVAGQNGTWYWRVRARNNVATGTWSSLRSFSYSF